MSDYQLNCTWEDVENSARSPNYFIRMYSGTDPVSGDTVDLSTASGTEIYERLYGNSNTDLVFVDSVGRQCVLTQRPSSATGEVKFSAVVGTTVYIYSIPDGGSRVYTTTVDIASNDVFPVLFTRVTINSATYECGESFDDIKAAILDNKVVFARTPDGIAWCSGELEDDEITFVVNDLTTNTQQFVLYVIDDQDSVIRSVVSGGGSGSADAVLYTSQTLTTAQQEQARTNIGALGASDIGTVFTLKGSVVNVASLPSSGNTVGDVYYVEAVSAGYIWLTNTTYPNGYWEELGETVDLSAYELKPTVVTVTGNTPTIALAENNKIYKCTGTGITSVTITARDTNAAFSVIFDAPSGASAPTFSYPTANMIMPDGFALEAYKHYEINVDSDGYAVVGSWSFD